MPLPDANDVGEGARAKLSETTDGLLANVADPGLLLADHRGGFGVVSVVFLGSMPGLYLVGWMVARRQDRLRSDSHLRRRVRAYHNARRALRAADRDGAAEHIYAALTGYVADRFNAPAPGMTREEAARLLDSHAVPEETRDEFNRLLEQIEFARYAGGQAGNIDESTRAAMKLLDAMERTDLR
jgi:hypothetical protein